MSVGGGGGVGGPSSVISWGKRGEGGQGREGVQLPDGVQSWVSRVKRRGLSTHPWGPLCSV